MPRGASTVHRVQRLYKAVELAGRVGAQVDPQHPPPTLFEGEQIAQRLRADERTKGVFGLGNRHALRRLIDQLEEEARVRAALVQLAGRVQESGPVAHRRGEPRPMPQSQADGFERSRRRRGWGQVGVQLSLIHI